MKRSSTVYYRPRIYLDLATPVDNMVHDFLKVSGNKRIVPLLLKSLLIIIAKSGDPTISLEDSICSKMGSIMSSAHEPVAFSKEEGCCRWRKAKDQEISR